MRNLTANFGKNIEVRKSLSKILPCKVENHLLEVLSPCSLTKLTGIDFCYNNKKECLRTRRTLFVEPNVLTSYAFFAFSTIALKASG